MSHKILAAGHICLDITPVFPEGKRYDRVDEVLVPGKMIHIRDADIHTGGSAANTGLALKLMGNDVRVMGKIGDDAFGRMVAKIVGGYGAEGLLVDEQAATSYTLVMALPGLDRFFLNCPGANDTFSQADIGDGDLDGVTLFHFGYPQLMRRMYEDGGRELEALFRRARARGVATSLDYAAIDPNADVGKADWPAITRRVMPWVDFFVPSFEEICYILDRERYDRLAARGGDMTAGLDVRAEAEPLADALLAMGCRVVLIKCGVSGMFYKTAGAEALAAIGGGLALRPEDWAEKSGVQPCYQADIVRSATGAGDVSIAAFLTAMLRGYPVDACASLAAAEGACAVTSYDALGGIRPLEELEERLAAGWERSGQA